MSLKICHSSGGRSIFFLFLLSSFFSGVFRGVPLREVPQAARLRIWIVGPQSDARYSCGQLFLWTASYVFRLLCSFPRMSFFYPCPGISPQRRSARSHRGGRGRVISHSDGHSIVRSTHCPPTNQLENYFRFERRFFVNFLLMNMERQKEPVHSTSNQREKISRYIFDETMYRL